MHAVFCRVLGQQCEEDNMSLFRSRRSDVWYTLILVGVIAALASCVAANLGLRLIYPASGWQGGEATIPPDLATFPLMAALVSAVLGPALWWRIIIKPGRLSVRRGIATGALTALIAHPIVWYVAFILAFFTGQHTVGSFLVSNPLLDLISALVLAAFSVAYVGWLTVSIGGVLGGIIALLQSISGCRGRWQRALSQ
jgi:hypothetical protein